MIFPMGLLHRRCLVAAEWGISRELAMWELGDEHTEAAVTLARCHLSHEAKEAWKAAWQALCLFADSIDAKSSFPPLGKKKKKLCGAYLTKSSLLLPLVSSSLWKTSMPQNSAWHVLSEEKSSSVHGQEWILEQEGSTTAQPERTENLSPVIANSWAGGKRLFWPCCSQQQPNSSFTTWTDPNMILGAPAKAGAFLADAYMSLFQGTAV